MGEGGGANGEQRRLQGETLAWEIWKERCQTIHNGENPKPNNAIIATTRLAEECWRARRTVQRAEVRPAPNRPTRWKKLENGTIKVNCDGAWEATTRNGGTRVITRDWNSNIIVGRSTLSKDSNAVELVVNQRWEDNIIESAAQIIIKTLQRSQNGMNWELKHILIDILDMANGIPRMRWNFVK